jgi:RNA polymerase sigma factor (sigma-70 family)
MLGVYLKQIDKLETLTAQQHIELFNMWKETGDKKHYNKLYNSLLKLIASVIIRRCGKNDPYVMDYIQEANLSIIRSLRNYDPSYGVPLFPYAIRYVKFLSSRFVMYQKNTVTIPMYKLERKNRTTKEYTFVSLNTKKYPQTSDDTYLDYMVGPDNPEEDAITKIDNDKFKSKVNRISLTDRQKYIIRENILNERFYPEIAKDLNVSRERIRQILNEAKQTISTELKDVADLHESSKEAVSQQ